MSIDSKSSYYDAGGIENMAIIKAKLTPEQYQGFLLGNIIKYSTRANWKGCYERDVEKLGVYQRLLARETLPSTLAEVFGTEVDWDGGWDGVEDFTDYTEVPMEEEVNIIPSVEDIKAPVMPNPFQKYRKVDDLPDEVA